MFQDMLQGALDAIGNHPTAAVVLVFLIAMGEALFIIGLFVPSTAVLVAAGTLVGMGKLSFWPIMIATSLGAIAGDQISYWVGATLKERIRSVWPFSRYQGLLDRGQAYFARHGGKSIFIGRFIPGVKAVVPGIAGMMDMNLARFTVINVVSGIFWAAAHILPSVAIGRGLNVARTANPRLLALILILAAIAALTWYLAKLAVRFLIPICDRARLAALDRLSGHPAPLAAGLRRLLGNENGILPAFIYLLLAFVAVAGFVAVAATFFFDPELARSDAAISAYLQSLRTGPFDRIMVLVTMFGDGITLTPIAIALVAALVAARRWRVAALTTTALIGSALLVPLLKSLIARNRPIALYEGVQMFSFPSSHAALSTTIIGLTVLLAAHHFALPVRRAIYTFGAILVALVAFSRVYLQAHWPSDVAAGILFGSAVVFIVAFLLHRMTPHPRGNLLAAFVVAVTLTAYGANLARGYDRALARYQPVAAVTQVAADAWASGAVADLPKARILLNGDYGEPILLLTDLQRGLLEESLAADGWSRRDDRFLDSIAGAIMPAASPLSTRPVLPLTNSGEKPIAIFVKPADGSLGGRWVLRLWRTAYVVEDDGRGHSIFALSATREVLDPIIGGYALVDALKDPGPSLDALADEVAGALPGTRLRGADGLRWAVKRTE